MPKRILQILGSTLLTALLLYAVFREKSFAEFADTIASVDKNLLLGYLSLSLFGVFCRAERYRLVLKDTALRDVAPSRYSMWIVTLIRNGLVDFLPARLGEASFLYVCSRYGFPLLSALSAFGVCLLLDVLVLLGLLLAFIFVQFLFVSSAASFGVSTTAILVLLGLTLVLAALLLQLDKILSFFIGLLEKYIPNRLPKRIEKAVHALLTWGKSVSTELAEIKKRGTYPQLATLTVGLRAAKYLSLYVLLLAVVAQFGVQASDISPLLSTTAFIGAEASASLPVSGLMGFGAYEAAWSAIFSISSVEIPSIAAVILAVHIITQVVGYSLALIALIGFLIDDFRSSRPKAASNKERNSNPLERDRAISNSH